MILEIDRACEFLTRKAAPAYNPKTCGYCARMIRQAVDFGFEKHIEQVPSAKDYGACYEKIGFEKIFSYPKEPKENYKPEKGDIAIIQYDPHGHICMKTEKNWISDFVQRDMYGGKIRDKDPAFDIYRYSTNPSL